MNKTQSNIDTMHKDRPLQKIQDDAIYPWYIDWLPVRKPQAIKKERNKL